MKKMLSLSQSQTLLTVNWNDWLIGFVEGDGHFHKHKDGHISFQIYQKEYAILERIKNYLQFGKIYYHKTSQIYQLIVGKEKDLRTIIHIFNGNLRTRYKHKQFELFLCTFNMKYSTPILFIDSRRPITLQDYWFSGFIDAEGSFFVSFYKKSYRFDFRFKIGQKTDRELCSKLKELYSNNKSCSVQYYKKHDFYEFRIDSLKGALLIFPYLDNFPLKTKKEQSYLRWKKMHQKLLNKMHLQRQKRTQLILEAKQINKSLKSHPKPK